MLERAILSNIWKTCSFTSSSSSGRKKSKPNQAKLRLGVRNFLRLMTMVMVNVILFFFFCKTVAPKKEMKHTHTRRWRLPRFAFLCSVVNISICAHCTVHWIRNVLIHPLITVHKQIWWNSQTKAQRRRRQRHCDQEIASKYTPLHMKRFNE